jgi:type II secretory pathway predicted ATPase ExeA
MYEAFFGLGKRPFTAMPDAGCFVPIDGIYQAFSSLAQCVADGRGIGVLTAPAGLGKSLICQRLVRELEGRFTVVHLPTGNFLTRRSLLQAILFELGHSHVRMEEQELRLALMSVLRRVRPGRGAIALIVDEAHLLAPRMLEELRALTNLADEGESLLRLVVSGQLPLEETLSLSSLDAFNQRIGIQTTLQPFTRQESAEYVSRRLAWAGVNVTDLLTRDALETVCEASDGSPRCLNQLCDHSLLLGYLASEKPISDRIVREALDDLKQLPLAWNEPLRRPSPLDELRASSQPEPSRAPANEDAWIVTADDEIVEPLSMAESEAIEFGHSIESDSPGPGPDSDADSFEIGASPTAKAAINVPSAKSPQPTVTVAVPIKPSSATIAPVFDAVQVDKHAGVVDKQDIVDEEVVIDRYAALDAAISRLTRTMLCARAITRRNESTAELPANEIATLTIEDEEPVTHAFDVVLPEEAPAENARMESVRTETVRAERVNTATSRIDSPSGPPAPNGGPRPLSGRRYEHLFSELRRRRKGA